MQYLHPTYDCADYDKDDNGRVAAITFDVFLSNGDVTIPDISENLVIIKELHKDTWLYSLIYYPDFNDVIELGERSAHFDYLSMEQSGIVIAEDVDGILKDFFEQNCSLSWEDTAEKLDFDDARFKKWTDLLINQTVNNRIKWSSHTSLNGRQNYTAFTGQNEVTLYTNNNVSSTAFSYYPFNESLLIRVGEWNGIAFGYDYLFTRDAYFSSDTESRPETVSTPILLKLEELVKKNITAFSEGAVSAKAAEKKLTYADCIVVCRSLICHRDGHIIRPYKGIIPILTADGQIADYEVYVGYCKNCYRYLIFQDDYRVMLEKGTPLCRVIEEDMDVSDNAAIRFNYKSESILYAMGYTVSEASSLSADERHIIMNKCISSKLLQVNDIIEFLNWLIVTRSPNTKYERAIGLWREDMSYLENKYAAATIGIKSIKARKPRMKSSPAKDTDL